MRTKGEVVRTTLVKSVQAGDDKVGELCNRYRAPRAPFIRKTQLVPCFWALSWSALEKDCESLIRCVMLAKFGFMRPNSGW